MENSLQFHLGTACVCVYLHIFPFGERCAAGTVNADARSAKLEGPFHVSCKLHSVPAEGGIHHVKVNRLLLVTRWAVASSRRESRQRNTARKIEAQTLASLFFLGPSFKPITSSSETTTSGRRYPLLLRASRGEFSAERHAR